MDKQHYQSTTQLISAERIYRIKEQGYYAGFSDEEISAHAVGNRFAFQLCTVLFTTGLLLTSIPILAVAVTIAMLTIILPYHPFDYLYNYGIRHWLQRPKLPRRAVQAKFACGMASIWLTAIIFAFQHSMFGLGYALGGVLFTMASLVSTLDLCLPSRIFNALFLRRKIREL